ncbi:MAG: T9SS type A sorting domain-containing protein [Bacteroidota bacterium]
MKSRKRYKSLLLVTFFSFVVVATTTAQDECVPDVNAPVATCNDNLQIVAAEGHGATVWAFNIDAGSLDGCSSVNLFLTTLEDDNGTPPESNSVLLPAEEGFNTTVILYVVDEAGNQNSCWSNVTISDVIDTGCSVDEEPPSIVCTNGITVALSSPGGSATVEASDFIVGLSDNCTVNPTISINLSDQSTGQPQGANSVTFFETGTYAVQIWAIDLFGNSNFCESYIIIQEPVGCENDVVPPIAVCESDLLINTYVGAEAIEILAEDLDDGSSDNCGVIDIRVVLASESNGILPSTTSIEIPSVLGTYPVEVWVVDPAGNDNYCLTNVTVNRILFPIHGEIYQDANDNCELDPSEENSGFGGWIVRATDVESGMTSTTTTNDDGSYIILLEVSSDVSRDIELELLLPDGISTGCPTSVFFENQSDPSLEANFALSLVEECSYLSVDVATPFLRRCFPNDISIRYSNFSANVVDNVTVNVMLDPFLAIQSASIPYAALGNGEYLFEIGTLPPASSGQLVINALLSCEAELGATHCVEATIEPFTCQATGNYAELVINGSCQEESDEVHFTVRNVGTANMIEAQEVLIVEDVIMYMNGNPLLLDAGQEEVMTFPANGSTWRLEIQQDASFPYGGLATAFVEGCGGFTQGIATQFTLSNTNPNVDVLCLENIGAYDPNDKQALPRGIGEEHYIEANTPLEYLIRFQNTGTDTAFNIRIEDQISEYLDPATIVPGASSHPYRMEVKEDGLLNFHFENIMLPDSNVNLEASNGFIQFSIKQLPDNPNNTVIENTAGIYFDFNDPVITNTVWHTIGEAFITVKAYEVLAPGLELSIAPNPVQTYTTISLRGVELEQAQCEMFDSQGRLIALLPMQNNALRIDRTELPQAGLYFFRIRQSGTLVAQGKLIVH